MNKRGSVDLVILGVVAVIAVIGLVLLFKGSTGQATGQPMTRDVLVENVDPWGIEYPGGYTCSCSGHCVYDGSTVSAVMPITEEQAPARANCEKTLKSKCAPQPLVDFNYVCSTR